MLTALPFVVALAGMVLVGRHSDRTGERQWHVAACALTAAAGLLIAVAFQDSVAMLVVGFTLSQLGQRSLLSVFWAIPPIFLGGSAAAAGIALINSIGNLGGAVGPTIMGWLRGVDRRLRRRPARAGDGARHRGDPGRVDAVAATGRACFHRRRRRTSRTSSMITITAETARAIATLPSIHAITPAAFSAGWNDGTSTSRFVATASTAITASAMQIGADARMQTQIPPPQRHRLHGRRQQPERRNRQVDRVPAGARLNEGRAGTEQQVGSRRHREPPGQHHAGHRDAERRLQRRPADAAGRHLRKVARIPLVLEGHARDLRVEQREHERRPTRRSSPRSAES